MTISKCDLCEREIKKGTGVRAGGESSFLGYELCATCGKPVKVFLEKLEKKLKAKKKQRGIK